MSRGKLRLSRSSVCQLQGTMEWRWGTGDRAVFGKRYLKIAWRQLRANVQRRMLQLHHSSPSFSPVDRFASFITPAEAELLFRRLSDV